MRNRKSLKVLVALSGGVDSAVAAKLLAGQGYKVAGVFLRFWQEALFHLTKRDRRDLVLGNRCCSDRALLDARRVANKIGIPLYTLNLAKIFKKQVVDNFLAEYARGKTPNPCVRCNKLVKLGYLIGWAKKLGFDYLATGHYAKNVKCQMSNVKIIYKLYKAKDKNKDQSYFLYTLNQDELKHLLFPLGNYTKPQVRRLAKKFKLPVAEKKESQEICFIADKSHNEFLKRHLKLKSGPIKILTPLAPLLRGSGEEVVGQHQGLPLYTIGQRKGINLSGGPFYVAKTDYKTNTLYVVNSCDGGALYTDNLVVKNTNWLAGRTPRLPLRCQAVIRYHHPPADCLIAKAKNGLTVKFKTAQRAITPGQSVVFYRGGEALGGGIIRPPSKGGVGGGSPGG
jgi:tRNA-specific 2-thiouridylase